MTLWAAKFNGELLPWSLGPTRRSMLETLEHMNREDWAALRKAGWSVVKVEVREVVREARDGSGV